MATAAEIQTAYKALYRADLNATVASAIAGTGISVDAYIAQQMPQVASTTQASVAIASFITGLTPTSDKLDALTVDANKQVASYTAMGSSNPQLGAFEAFGRAFATDSTTGVTFAAKYGSLSTTDFISVVYAQVYGTQPNAAQLASLQGQIDYFTKLYATNNVPNGAIAAKGAVLGQIVGYAFTSSASVNSSLDNQVQSMLTSAAKGDTSVYNKALPTVTDPGQIGVSIALTAGADVVSPTSADPALKSTANNDTINAASGNLTNGDAIDAGAGADTLVATLSAGISLDPTLAAAAKVALTSVEVLKFAGAGFTVDAKGVVGVTDIIATKGGALTVDNIAAATNLGVESNDGNVQFGFGTTSAAASTTIKLTGATSTLKVGDGAAAGQVGATAVTLNVATNSSAALVLEDATSLKILGAGNTNFTIAGAANQSDKLATIDASASTGKIGLTLNTAQVNTAVTLSGQDDIFSTDASTLKLVTVATGAGADKVAVAPTVAGGNVSFNADNTLKTGLVVSDFTKGTDKVDLTAATMGTFANLSAATQTAINAAANEKAAYDAAIADLAAGKFGIYEYQGNTYVVSEGADNAVATDNVIVKLAGVTGLSHGAATTSDLLHV